VSARKLAVLPPAVAAKIDDERRRLQRAAVLLECVAVAYDAGRDVEFSDGMHVVREMIDAGVEALDSVELRRPPSKASEDDD
jgi:hypothetical protein